MKRIEINSLLLKLENNKVKLNVQDKRFLKYKEFLAEIRNKNPFKKQKDFQIKDSDFVNSLKKDYESTPISDKPKFISFKIEKNNVKLDDISEDIEKLNSKNEVDKEAIFIKLEQNINELEVIIIHLKEANRELRKELELILEKQNKTSEKDSLRKENKDLKEKIQNLKEKTDKQKDDFNSKVNDSKSPESTATKFLQNKVTYEKEKER